MRLPITFGRGNLEEGQGHREAARHFRVSPRFVNDLLILKRENGSLAPRRQGHGAGSGKLSPHRDWLKERMMRDGERTLNVLCLELAGRGIVVDRSSIGWLLHRLGLSHKNVWPARLQGDFAVLLISLRQTYTVS